MNQNAKISYIELPAQDIDKVQKFYGAVFGWTFEDYGPDYCAFNDGNMDGGFYRSPLASDSNNGAVLVILYADDLEGTIDRVAAHGGEIKKPIFAFPGGRRFHFLDPNKNELAVWSDQ